MKFAPVGDKILELLNSAMDPLLSVVDRAVKAFNSLPDPMKKAAIAAGILSFALGPLRTATGGILQTAGAIGNLATVLLQARAAGGLSVIFGAGGPAGIISALTSINPLVLALTAAVTGGAIAWTIYSQKLQDAFASMDDARRRRPGRLETPGVAFGTSSNQEILNLVNLGPDNKYPSGQNAALTKNEAQSIINQRLDQIASDSKIGRAAAIAKLEEIRKSDAKLDEAIRFVQKERELRRSISGSGVGAGEKSIFERMSEELAEVNKQIAILQNAGGREFALKLDIDKARAFQQNLEKILELRREVGLPIKEPLPKTDKGAEEAVRRLGALKDFQEGLAKLSANPPKLSTEFFDKINKDLKAQLTATRRRPPICSESAKEPLTD